VKSACPGDEWLPGDPALFCHILNSVAVSVPCGKIHQTIDSGRVLLQGLFNSTHGFHKLTPVGGAQEPEASEAVADGKLISRLPLVLRFKQLCDGQARLRQLLLDPGKGHSLLAGAVLLLESVPE